jgi:hypothetical protein
LNGCIFILALKISPEFLEFSPQAPEIFVKTLHGDWDWIRKKNRG